MLFRSEVGPTAWALDLSVMPIPAAARSGPVGGIAIGPEIFGTVPAAKFGNVEVKPSASFQSDHGLSLEIRPSGITPVASLSLPAALDEGLELAYRPPEPRIIVGGAGTTRLEVYDATVRFHVAGPVSGPEVFVGLETTRCEAVIAAGEGDGFLSKILGSEAKTFRFALSIGWSSKGGLCTGGVPWR